MHVASDNLFCFVLRAEACGGAQYLHSPGKEQ